MQMSAVKRNYIFDFDSTLTRVEALDVLAEITLANNPKKNEIPAAIDPKMKTPLSGF